MACATPEAAGRLRAVMPGAVLSNVKFSSGGRLLRQMASDGFYTQAVLLRAAAFDPRFKEEMKGFGEYVLGASPWYVRV